MEVCECMELCPYLNKMLPNSTALGELYKQTYCSGNKYACARYMVNKTCGEEYVELELAPYMSMRADKIIEEYRK
jgi:hypothetical protein